MVQGRQSEEINSDPGSNRPVRIDFRQKERLWKLFMFVSKPSCLFFLPFFHKLLVHLLEGRVPYISWGIRMIFFNTLPFLPTENWVALWKTENMNRKQKVDYSTHPRGYRIRAMKTMILREHLCSLTAQNNLYVQKNLPQRAYALAVCTDSTTRSWDEWCSTHPKGLQLSHHYNFETLEPRGCFRCFSPD